MYRITRCDDVEEAKDAHTLAFPADAWPGDEHAYWLARDESNKIVGFCSAREYAQSFVYLSRAAVTLETAGRGLHRDMIRRRVGWAKNLGVPLVLAYVGRYNYGSLHNLMSCGFRAIEKSLGTFGWRHENYWHILYRRFDERAQNLKALRSMVREVL